MGSSPSIYQLEEAAASASAQEQNALEAGDSAAAAAAYTQALETDAQLETIYAGSPAASTLQQDQTAYVLQALTPTAPPAPPAPAVTPIVPSTSSAAGTSAVGSTAPAAPAVVTPGSGQLQARDLFDGDPASYCDLFPDDPLCQAFGIGLPGLPGGSVNVTSTVSLESVTIVQNGISATDVAGIVDGSLGDLWDAVVGAVDGVIAAAVAEIQKVLTDLGNALKAAYNILSRLAGFILNLLKQLLDEVVKGILGVLQDLRNLLTDLYKDVLVPIVNGVLAIRKALLDVYQRFIRPMLIVLQNIRRVLSILAAFHIAFAQKLDSALADLEARITRPLFYLLTLVNGVANWVNLIITAGYLLQKSVFLNSLNAYIGESINLQLNAMTAPPDPAAIAAAQAANQVPTAAQAVADFDAFLTTDSGPLPPVIAQYSAQFDTYLSQGV
jgi:hypothetical protein